MRRYEGRIIERALKDANGLVTHAARLLGYEHHYTLINKINKWHRHLLSTRSPIIQRRRSIIFMDEDKKETRPEVRESLLAWLDSPYCGKEYLFPSPVNPNRHVSRATVYTHFREAVERAGIANFSIHKLRHTFGTNLAPHVPLHEMKELMGHSKVETTLIYAHSSLASKRAAVEHAIPHGNLIHAEEKFTKAG